MDTPAKTELLPNHMALEWIEVGHGLVRGKFEVRPFHMAPNGFMHAASVIALADSACGVGCARSLPEGASGFTTIELKSNFLGSASVGEIVAAEARLVHGGRTTQLWDADVVNQSRGKTIAVFRCTQLVLYPKK